MRLCKTTAGRRAAGRTWPNQTMARGIVTAALIGAAVTTCAFVAYALLSPPLPPRVLASADAHQMLITSWPSSECHGRCDADVLEREPGGGWRVRLVSPGWRRCFIVDPKRFSWSAQRGLTGVAQV